MRVRRRGMRLSGFETSWSGEIRHTSAGVTKRMGFWGGRRGSPSTAEREGLQVAKGRGEDPGPGIGFRHRDPDVADGQTDSGADLEQL